MKVLDTYYIFLESLKPATLLKIDFGIGVFLRMASSFLEQIFFENLFEKLFLEML